MKILAQIGLPLILMFMMFTMGLNITKNDLKKVVLFPKAFALGAFLQIVALPVMALIISYIWVTKFGVDPLLGVGLMVIAACPGGVTSNMFTYLAKADLALSVSLTSIISLLSVFTTPFIVQTAVSIFVENPSILEFDLTKMVLGVFVISTVPVIIGMILNAKKPEFAQKIEPKLRKMSTIFFVIITIAAIAKEWTIIKDSIHLVGATTLLLNVLCMLIAFLVARTFLLSQAQERAIVYECGLQNGTMGIFISLTILNSEIVVIPSALYSINMFLTGGLFLFYIMKKKKPSAVVTA